MTRLLGSLRAGVLTALVLSAACSALSAYEVTVGNRKCWTYPHRPIATIASLAELQKRYSLVTGMLPASPFVMDGRWVIIDSSGALHILPYDPTWRETLSPSGKWILQRKRVDPKHLELGGVTRLLTGDGKVRSTSDRYLELASVTDEGQVVFYDFDPYPARTAVTVLAPDGHELSRTTEVLALTHDRPQDSPPLVLPSDKIIAIRGVDQAVGLSLDGRIRWRYRAPAPANYIAKMIVDPAGRGLAVVLTYPASRNSTVHFIDSKTGQVTGALWTDAPRSSPNTFSAVGKYGADVAGAHIVAMDWLTGRELWRKVAGVDVPTGFGVTKAFASSLSDTGLVAAPLDSGTTVFNVDGKTIWECDIRADGYAKRTLSPDGSRLAVVCMTTTLPPVVEGLLLYDLTRD